MQLSRQHVVDVLRKTGLSEEADEALRELPDPVRAEMEFIFAEKIEEVLKAALQGPAESLQLVA